ILPIEIPQKKGSPVVFKVDESVRTDCSLEGLAKLKPAFDKAGSVTAGNAPGINDAAAAVAVVSAEAARGHNVLGRIVAQATGGVEPKLVMMAPVVAVKKLLEKTGWKPSSIDLIELN